jgi:hypothetical protein
MTMTMKINAISVAPPSPAVSPRSSPFSSVVTGRNLKVDNGTQPAHDDVHPFTLTAALLAAWDEKYNRRSAPLMPGKDFKRLVTTVLRKFGGSAITDGAVEAALAECMQQKTYELTSQLERAKRLVFLQDDVPDEVDDLLPFVQQETHHGWSKYIIHTLPKLSQLRYTQQPAKTAPPSLPSPPPGPTLPQPPRQRPTRIQKTRKKECIASVRRSDRIKNLTLKGAQ